MRYKAIMRHIARISMCMVLLSANANAEAKDHAQLHVQDIKVARLDSNLVVALDINPRSVNPGRDREAVFTPVIVALNGTDSLELPSIRVAGRNRYYSHLRNDDLEDGEKIINAGSGDLLQYRDETPFEPWMSRSRITMRREVANCCDAPVLEGYTPVAELDYEPKAFMPSITRYVALLGDSAVERSAEGRAFVDFIVNRTEIRPNYRGNKAELAKIIASIDTIKNDPDAVITRVTIKGFASPEGSYSNNVRLAMGRTAALKEYVREHYNFNPEIMSTDYEPEDWDGLRNWVEKCTLPHRSEILDIINSSMEPDPKDHELKRRFPAEYKIMLDSIYPALRHSDYTVKYRFRTFVDIDELKKVYANTPDRLRPVDFQRIAATYPEGSDDFKDVMLTAARIYPHDEAACLNAANITMERGDYAAAAEYLRHAGDSPEAVFTRGMLAARTGDFRRASELLDAAKRAGSVPAAEESQRLEQHMNIPSVTYLIEPEK